MNRIHIDCFDKDLLNAVQERLGNFISNPIHKDERVSMKVSNVKEFECKIAYLYQRDILLNSDDIHVCVNSIPFTMFENVFNLDSSRIEYSMGTRTRVNTHYLNMLGTKEIHIFIKTDWESKFDNIISGYYNNSRVITIDSTNMIEILKKIQEVVDVQNSSHRGSKQ